MSKITTVAEVNDLCNKVTLAGIKLPSNVRLEIRVSQIEFADLVEKFGKTYKIQKSMIRSEAIEMQVNGVKVKYTMI